MQNGNVNVNYINPSPVRLSIKPTEIEELMEIGKKAKKR